MWRLLVLLLLHPVSATELASLKEDEDAYAGEASTVDGQLISLVQAKGADDPSLVSELLSNGASPSASGLYNYTAIMWAVVRHKVATLQALLDAGGDPGRDALFLAAWEGEPMVRLLIDHGADVSACAEHDEWTPLHKAAEKGSLPVVAMLLEAGADPHARTLPDKTFEDGIVPVDLARRKLKRLGKKKAPGEAAELRQLIALLVQHSQGEKEEL
ncbi:hypothetical protein EMIHUDRAFT_207257 [Emiliania huxleyi CCMP1516]|uniref:Ankyrin repeat domain-containing protein n=2 Tax=Emiliania huxleyi TaxID=2903 RepID=A0A0D3JDF7_EMIH1|nr:hypothetical protein EMIHUDRAFT_241075 [Emiliania huxleyi CCMP1516]XP_005774564.1 hypothetical protein EMIHUDRAFT_207257 [Emiliania huxleyi CCMP1516]EOD21542.1 hypothetical protein EMIHUDRAFT_241075 [Emiliania huxleyi CCMP1516]EOD22135.1 hypothetical protein EMIHUDRAFT_207257 [Emiliania huxleyi CCMP1516]|eukprot:XP_005773971.1 hypothetical protein EMIHUDRAFT_241075 [Emiliania huxleyi CCMP1516]